MTRLTEVSFCFVLFLALANCVSFEDIVHNRGLKTIYNCPLVYAGSDWFGGDINTSPITGIGSASGCCYRCNRLYGYRVRAYIYRTDHDHCWCKHTVNHPSHCTACHGRNGGEYRAPSSCSPRYNYDSFGYDLPGMPITGVTQPGACCGRCRRYRGLNLILNFSCIPKPVRLRVGCVAWVWRRDFNRCYLKSRTVPFTSCPQCVYGRG